MEELSEGGKDGLLFLAYYSQVIQSTTLHDTHSTYFRLSKLLVN